MPCVFCLLLDLYDHRYEGDNFVLDQQVTRAALKSYRALLSSSSPSESQLSPSTQYLRVFLPGHSQPPSINAKWDDPQTAILLLEWRAALSVKAYATHHEDSDASIDRRVSKAITEAFVASQVGEMLKTLQDKLPGREAQVLRRLFTLVSCMSAATICPISLLTKCVFETVSADDIRIGARRHTLIRASSRNFALQVARS